MGKKSLASLPMEGKLHADGLQSSDADDDLLTAMARDSVTRQGVGEGAAEGWRGSVQKSGKAVPILAAVESTPTIPEHEEATAWVRPFDPPAGPM
ncbi:hypothetical protein OY671_011052, partial [Metschnikowia pulcherrima]